MRVVRSSAAVAAIFVLGACQSSGAVAGGPAPTQPSSTARVPTTTGPTSPAAKPSTAKPEPSRTSDSGSVGDCTPADTKIVATPVREPIDHLLLTVTDTGSAPCRLYNFPDLRFDIHPADPVNPLDASRTATIVALAPGASAYAGITLSSAAGGETGRIARTVAVTLPRVDLVHDSLHTPVSVALPANTYVVYGQAAVTYWQESQQAALAW